MGLFHIIRFHHKDAIGRNKNSTPPDPILWLKTIEKWTFFDGLLSPYMIESITTIRNRYGIKAKLLISLCFIRVKWHFITFIYTVMEREDKNYRII